LLNSPTRLVKNSRVSASLSGARSL